EYKHCWNAANTEPRGGGRVFVYIQLGDLDLAGQLGCKLLDRGSKAQARTTPGCPEIDECELWRLLDLGSEGGIGNHNRSARRHVTGEWRLASSANRFEPGFRAAGCDPVGRSTGWTADQF